MTFWKLNFENQWNLCCANRLNILLWSLFSILSQSTWQCQEAVGSPPDLLRETKTRRALSLEDLKRFVGLSFWQISVKMNEKIISGFTSALIFVPLSSSSPSPFPPPPPPPLVSPPFPGKYRPRRHHWWPPKIRDRAGYQLLWEGTSSLMKHGY